MQSFTKHRKSFAQWTGKPYYLNIKWGNGLMYMFVSHTRLMCHSLSRKRLDLNHSASRAAG